MNAIKILFTAILLGASISSCKTNQVDVNIIEVTGVLQKQGITTYQYGTHVITDYALRSDVVELDDYVNQRVTVVGRKIEGYPVDGGPDYLEVTKVK